MRTAQSKATTRPYKNKIKTNKNLNKSVFRKPKKSSITLSRYQYENILIMLRKDFRSWKRICNNYKLNVAEKFFRDLVDNNLPEYKKWWSKK